MYLSPHDTIEYLLNEITAPETQDIPDANLKGDARASYETLERQEDQRSNEHNPLLSSSDPFDYGTSTVESTLARSRRGRPRRSITGKYLSTSHDKYSLFYGLNALEIGSVAQAKKFMSQKVVQRVINDLWGGAIVLWDNLSVHSRRKPQVFNKRYAYLPCEILVNSY